MTMIMSTDDVPAYRKIVGSEEDFVLTEGQQLKVESSPNGEEHYLGTVPVDKQWTCTVTVRIIETDV